MKKITFEEPILEILNLNPQKTVKDNTGIMPLNDDADYSEVDMDWGNDWE